MCSASGRVTSPDNLVSWINERFVFSINGSFAIDLRQPIAHPLAQAAYRDPVQVGDPVRAAEAELAVMAPLRG
jgi:hypothetical protein